MANNLSRVPVKDLVKRDEIQQMLARTLGNKARQFATSVVNVVNGNQDLTGVDQLSVINSAMVAATLNLPIDQNLGYMWLVPYKGKATPQIGYKGYIQLAQRTGQYKSMNAIAVHEGEIKNWNPLTEEFEFDPEGKVSDQVIGYVGYFKLVNGFEKTVYWSLENMEDHRKRFSKMSSKDKPSGVWASDYDSMAIKTVLRNMLNKWGPMSIELETAMSNDEREPQQSIDIDLAGSTASDTTDSMLEEFRKSQDESGSRKNVTEEGEINADQSETNESNSVNDDDTQSTKVDQGKLL